MRRLLHHAVLLCLALTGAGAAVPHALAQAPRPEQPRQEQPPQQRPAEPAVATDARLTGDQSRTRFVVDLDRAVPIAVFVLADPYRVVVDVPEVAFRLPSTAGRDGRGLVGAYRFGQFAPGRSRIVIDLREPVRVDRAQVSPATDTQPARLVIELVRTSRAEFLRAIERRSEGRAEDPPAPRAGTPARDAAPQIAARPREELPLVVLDPGHGGVDTGAISAEGHHEKQIVLEFAVTLRQALERTGRVRVALTREDDSFIRLDERVRFARERQAALFLSIHADSFARQFVGVSGASVYTLSERASDREAAAYAERENRADQIAGVESPPQSDEVADILFDLMHRETKNFSVHFARVLVEELRPHVRLVRNPHRFAGFRVLRAPDVPSALLELGYLSNRDDVRQLMSETWRRQTADAIARAVVAFISTSRAGTPGPRAETPAR